jgi:hypothetical protein
MATSTNKTTPTDESVRAYIDRIENRQQRADAESLVAIMSAATGEPAVMWGTSIVGFGSHHYVYESGREGDTPTVAFSARKKALVLYGVARYAVDESANEILLNDLGPHEMGKGCLYIASLQDVDTAVLKRMIVNAYSYKSKQAH